MTDAAQHTDRPKRIAIVGGGTAGWMAAGLMQAAWGAEGVDITAIEAPDIGIIGVGEGSTPQLKAFFDKLGVDEREWMPACNATYKNGISFHGWSDRAGCESYFHPFPAPIDAHTAPAFFFNSHYRRQGFDLEAHPDHFFLSAYLAKNRLAPTPAENFPFEMAYGYHFDAYLVGAFLRDRAKSAGVRHLEAEVGGVDLSTTGDIVSLRLKDGRVVEADFFVDATGFRSLLLQQSMGVPFRSFGENLFADAAVVMPTPPDADGLNSQTKATALSAGWAWDIPLTNRTGNGYVYSSKYLDAEDAERELRAHLGLGDADPSARHLRMKVGQVAEHWRGNCLAVGLSQGFIEPLEATALHLVQATAEGFIDAVEAGGFKDGRRDEFNRYVSGRFEGVRDYIVLHYQANRRNDGVYWRDNAANARRSDRLGRLIECWRAGGDLKREVAETGAGEFYPLTSWICLLGGYGHYPDDKSLRAPPTELARFDVDEIREFIRRCGLNFPDHRAKLADAAKSAFGST